MSLSSLELWQRLADERLATPEQCRQWAAEILPKQAGAEQQSGLKILQLLIEGGYLSKYQAKIIAGQAMGPLRWGPWVVLQAVKAPLWQRWYWMRRGGDEPIWGRPLSAGELEQLRTALPSMPRALKLSTVQHANLAPIPAPELIDGTLLVFVTPHSSAFPSGIPLDGTLLSQRFASQRCSTQQATRIVGQLADALAALHKIGVPHGRVLPDRIYVHDQQVVLAIDPLCAGTGLPTVNGSNAISTGLIDHQLQPVQVAQFSAPELLLSNSLPSPASDVYSLGCLWWWLFTGDLPTVCDPNQTSVQSRLATFPTDCELPEPLRLCLQACIGGNPSSRFASAVELTHALAAAERAKPIPAVKPRQQVVAEPARAPVKPVPGSASRPLVANPKVIRSSPSRKVEPSNSPLVTRRATTSPTPSQKIQSPVPTSSASRRRRRQGFPWLWPILGGCGLLVGLLIVLKVSGVLTHSPESSRAISRRSSGDYVPPMREQPTDLAKPDANDPRSEFYEIVASDASGNQSDLWAPPHAPDPFPLDLLPPGGQLFVSLRPAQWPRDETSDELPTVFGWQLSSIIELVRTTAGVPSADLTQVTLACYSPTQSGEPPRVCLRFHLSQPTPLSELKAAWSNPAVDDDSTPGLLVGSSDQAYYVAGQAQTGMQSVSDFSVGPVELMREVAELSGARGPLLPHLQKLWNNTDQSADVAVFVSTPFLFTDGRELFAGTPDRFNKTLKQWLGGDVRGASLHVHWNPTWYMETRVVGTNDLDAGKLMLRQHQQIEALPDDVEHWLVSHAAHPYWRALALRYPQMLRTFVDYSRFGVEHGTAIMNCYLPSSGGMNLVLTSWIAMQQQSTLGSDVVATNSQASNSPLTKPLDIEAYLSRPVRLSFDSEAIEVALRMIGEEANANLPTGTLPVRFALDGAAFEKAGLTRNKQLRDFHIEQQPVREAITEIAKVGNLVTTVTDLHQPEQTLIWIVIPDPERTDGASMVSLTTRTAAAAAGHKLPAEFAP
ncbi:MAG: hypothetical protein ABI557_00135 [Aureliella sp.]